MKRLAEQNINVDRKKVNDLHDYRNDIEHYFDSNSSDKSIVGSYIANSFLIIKKFIEEEFNYNPQECFSEEIWQELLKEESVHGAELLSKIADFDNLSWFSGDVEQAFLEHRCSACDSDLIRVYATKEGSAEAHNADFECRNCSRQWTYEELAKEIADDLSTENAMSWRDGGPEIIAFCPRCFTESYYTEGEVCLLCGEKGPFLCSCDDEPVPPEEYPTYAETGRCAYHEHIFEDIMDDDE